MSNLSGIGLATKGYISPQGGGLPTTINVLAVTVAATHLDIQFSVPVFLAAYGQDATHWTITSVSGVFYPTTPTGVFSANADTIRLLVDEMTNNGLFSLVLVVGLVESVAADASNKEESVPFTGVGLPVGILSAVPQTSRTILVTFDRPMYLPDLADHTLYLVYGPAPAIDLLPVTAAGALSSTTAMLTTGTMRAGSTYLADSFCRTRAGNSGLHLVSINVTYDRSDIPADIYMQMTATGLYSDGTSADITTSVVWSSDNSAVATVDANGLVTSIAPGSTNITAAQVSPNYVETVTPLNVYAIQGYYSGGLGPVAVGANLQMLVIAVRPVDFVQVDVTSLGAFVGNYTPLLASITPGGLATGISPGQAWTVWNATSPSSYQANVLFLVV